MKEIKAKSLVLEKKQVPFFHRQYLESNANYECFCGRVFSVRTLRSIVTWILHDVAAMELLLVCVIFFFFCIINENVNMLFLNSLI